MKRMVIAALLVLLAAAGAAGWIVWQRGAAERLFSALEAGQRPEGARTRLQKVLVENPDLLLAQKWLLRLEIEAGDLSAAESRLRLLDIKAPDYYGTAAGGCYFYLVKKEGGTAARYCERAVELSGRSVDDLNRLGTAYMQAGNLFKALPPLREAHQKMPGNLKVTNNLGYYYLLAGVYRDAIKLFEEALQKDPAFLEARRNLAHALYNAGQYPQAAEEIKTILQKQPRNKDLLMILAYIYGANLKNKAEGTRYAREAIAAGMDRERANRLLDMIEGKQAPQPQCPFPDQNQPPQLQQPPDWKGPTIEEPTSGATAGETPVPAPPPAAGATVPAAAGATAPAGARP